MGLLDGRTALVTGGSRGIGRAIVERLVVDGASVVFSYNANRAAADEVAERVSHAGGRVHAVRADQGELDDVGRLVAEAEGALGGLDILVINAGAGAQIPVGDVTEVDYDRIMAVNAKGPFFLLQRCIPLLRDGGRVIAISTLNTVLPAPAISLYAASKAALEQFVKIAARELGPREITVNSVSPGLTDTTMMNEGNPTEAQAQAIESTALQRLGRPSDIAGVVAFLAEPDSGWITGQNVIASGGLLL